MEPKKKKIIVIRIRIRIVIVIYKSAHGKIRKRTVHLLLDKIHGKLIITKIILSRPLDVPVRPRAR